MQDVTVIGAGPTGMTAALVLARAGVDVTVLEALDGLSTNSRASTFHPPTLEMAETLGVLDEMLEAGVRVDTFQYRSRVDGKVAELNLNVLADDTPYPFRLQLPQNVYTAILRDRLADLGVDVEFGQSVVDLSVGPDQVLIDTDEPGGDRSASWVIGADGASSVVRHALGVPFDGMTYAERFLVVTTTFPLEDHLEDLAPVNYVSDADEWLVLLRIPGAWRVLFPVPADELSDEEAEERVRERLGGVVDRAAQAPIDEWSRYAVHQRVAGTFRVGRVLLAGDAAHVNSPIGGMGMNSGVHDAFAFARGFLDVLRDDAPAATLDEIARARRDHALDVVQVTTDRNTRNLALSDPEQDRARRASLRALAQDRERMREHLLASSMLASTHDLVSAVTGRP